VICTYERGDVRFAIWVGPGRDPQVAYLDARQSVMAGSELGTSGLLLYDSGSSRNLLGGRREGDIDRAVLHRVVHVVTDHDGTSLFHLQAPCRDAPAADGLCAAARSEPRPGMDAEPLGSLVTEPGFALQWVTWDDPVRTDVLRHAVYADERYLLDAGTGHDGSVRAWPSRLLEPHGLELVAPSAEELARIEERIASVTTPAGGA
jgi:hypothetical protein